MGHAVILAGVTAAAAAAVTAAGATTAAGHSSPLPSHGAVTGEPAQAFVTLATGSLGGFPYCWQNPRTLQFNRLTYDWINTAVSGEADPARLSNVFTNNFALALSSVRYSLSSAEQAQIHAAGARVAMAQLTLLSAWRASFGQTWAGSAGPPIDVVVERITAGWAQTPVTLDALVASQDWRQLLPNMPSQGAPIVPALAGYLSAISDMRREVDRCRRHNGLLSMAVTALLAPERTAGSLLLDDGSLVPGYRVRDSVAEIVAGLSGEAALDARIVSQALSSGASLATLDGTVTSLARPARLLGLDTSDGDEIAGAALAAAASPVAITARFEGVTSVLFDPAPFDPKAINGWFWEEPIVAAARAAPGDSGFAFSPRPPFDFSKNGRFGRLTGVLIARAPKLSLRLDPATAERIADSVNSDAGATLSFLNQTVSSPDTIEQICATVLPGNSGDTALLCLTPAATASVTPTSRAYVLGGIVSFPNV